ncbi:Lsr2 family protein [Mycobacterium sp. CBMA226]|nr:Lsr2 family protein [Mycolicibacterium sp. CBMA 226]
MAKRYSTTWTDDLDGSPAAETIEFSIDGVTYAIDLSDANALRMRGTFEPYIRVARKASRRRVRTNWRLEQPSFEEPPISHQRVRAWLRMNGHDVGSRGRLSKDLLRRYEVAHAGRG